MARNTPTDRNRKQDTAVERSSSASRGLSLFEDADRLWDTFIERLGFNEPWGLSGFNDPRARQWLRRPRVDVAERDDDLIVTAEIPGLKSDDLDIAVTNDVLTLRAEQSSERHEDEGEYHRREIMSGSFVRHIRLPCSVDADRAQASYRDGVLRLALPKAAREHTRKIAIAADQEQQARTRPARSKAPGPTGDTDLNRSGV